MSDFLDNADESFEIDFSNTGVVDTADDQAQDPPSFDTSNKEEPVDPAAAGGPAAPAAPDGADTDKEPTISFKLEGEPDSDDDPIAALAIDLGLPEEKVKDIKTVKEMRALVAEELKKFTNTDEVQRPDLSRYDEIIGADLSDTDTVFSLAEKHLIAAGTPNPAVVLEKMDDSQLLSLAQQMVSAATSGRKLEVDKYNKAVADKAAEHDAAVNKVKEQEIAFENSFIQGCNEGKITLAGVKIEESFARKILDIRKDPKGSGLLEDLRDPQKIVDMIVAVSSNKLVSHVRNQLKEIERRRAESTFVKEKLGDDLNLKTDKAKDGRATQATSSSIEEVESADDSFTLNF